MDTSEPFTARRDRDGRVAFSYTLTLWRLPEGELHLEGRKVSSRGIGVSRHWNCSPGNSPVKAYEDAVAWLYDSMAHDFLSAVRL